MPKKNLMIAILNLMPTKEATANQLENLLINSQHECVEVVLFYPESHYETKPLPELLAQHYYPFSRLVEQEFDGVIVTGAPVERLAFEEVDYWSELCQTLTLIKNKGIPMLSICWGAQAALYHHYQVEKVALTEKIVGVFDHQLRLAKHPVFSKLKPQFKAPHSRYTTVKVSQVLAHPDLVVVADSEEAGLYLVTNNKGNETYVFGHAEYEQDTLNLEYQRDLATTSDAVFPKHYYPNNQVEGRPQKTWEEHGQALFSQWVSSLARNAVTLTS